MRAVPSQQPGTFARMARQSHRSLWLLGSAIVYILAQFIWWTVLLLRRETEIAQLKGSLGRLDQAAGTSRTWMVLGEAGVFMILLGTVLMLAFLAIRRDLRLAALQRNFLLAITHELRTPVASMKLQLQTLSRPGLGEADAQSLRLAAIEEADRLAALTDKVLAATADGEEQIPLRPEPVNATDIVRGAVNRARLRDSSGHVWNLRLLPECHVNADPQALRSIVENLVENAVKYAPAGSEIGVELLDLGSSWRLVVTDHGPGIPEKEHSRVFERFYRVGDEATRSAPGTGLGLFVVKRLVQRHGGRIELSDTVPHGATFAATFPKNN